MDVRMLRNKDLDTIIQHLIDIMYQSPQFKKQLIICLEEKNKRTGDNK